MEDFSQSTGSNVQNMNTAYTNGIAGSGTVTNPATKASGQVESNENAAHRAREGLSHAL